MVVIASRLVVSPAYILSHASADVYEDGLRAYDAGAVQSLVLVGDTVHAEIAGSAGIPYRVAATIGERFIETLCSCQFDDGGWCKHTVAALLSYVYDREVVAEKAGLQEVLASLSRGQLLALLSRMAEEDPTLVAVIDRHAAQAASPQPAGTES